MTMRKPSTISCSLDTEAIVNTGLAALNLVRSQAEEKCGRRGHHHVAAFASPKVDVVLKVIRDRPFASYK